MKIRSAPLAASLILALAAPLFRSPACASHAPAVCAVEDGVLLSRRADRDSDLTADPDSPFWRDAVPGVYIEESVLGGAVPGYRAEVRSRWTEGFFYFLFIGPYESLTLLPNPDTAVETYRLWERDCFEVYLGADFENVNRYREFQMSPQGEFLDLDIDATRPKPGHGDERLWDSGMAVKARVDAERKIWFGEMRIPVAAVDARPPRPGNELRLNLYRQDGKPPKRIFMGWRPTGFWNPHHPDKFGILRLAGESFFGPIMVSMAFLKRSRRSKNGCCFTDWASDSPIDPKSAKM